ncbi:hypothetical protein Tco_0581882 [Tanacetum coccineum]
MVVVENIAVVMIVVKKVVVEYFLDSSNFGSRIVVVDDTPIVIDKLDRVTIAFQKEDTVRKNLSFVTPGASRRINGTNLEARDHKEDKSKDGRETFLRTNSISSNTTEEKKLEKIIANPRSFKSLYLSFSTTNLTMKK